MIPFKNEKKDILKDRIQLTKGIGLSGGNQNHNNSNF